MSGQLFMGSEFASRRMPPVTIGIDPVALAKLRELVGPAGKFRDQRPDGSRAWSQTYGDLIRWAVKEFLAKHAPEPKKPTKPVVVAKTKTKAAKKSAPKKPAKKPTKKGGRR